MTGEGHEVWITGIGLVSSLGEGCDAHWSHLSQAGIPKPVIDTAAFAPYPVHPMPELDYSTQIPKRGDQRQMGPWQRLGTYAAGLALDDAGLSGDPDALGRINMVVAAGGGERDIDVDTAILSGMGSHNDQRAFMNEMMMNELRPTLFLAQLSNLLAGNISIVHGVTGSSRTFMGEEMAGVSAMEVAVRRIASGQGDLFLVGSAYNAERLDMLLINELSRSMWKGDAVPVWERSAAGGGMISGSVGVFLILESRAHAKARQADGYARISGVLSDRCDRSPGAARRIGERQARALLSGSGGELAVISGASGASPSTEEELQFLNGLTGMGYQPAIRASATVLGHSMETQFPADVALAALAVSKGAFYGPFDGSGTEKPYSGSAEQILVTCWGHWRGEGAALVEAIHPEGS